MNRIIRTLAVAAPIAIAGLTLAPAAAMATEPGPVIVLPPSQPDPQPDLPIAQPTPEPDQPQGPGDIANPDDGGPKGPGDITDPTPEPTHPQGPGDLTAPQPCPTHGVVCGDGGDQGKGDQGDHAATPTSTKPHVVVDSVALPTRVDAGLAGDTQGGAEGDLELSWLLAGGALVTASGVAFAVRKRARA